MPISSIKEFLRLEAASGILLFIAAVLAMIAVNSPANHLYDIFLSTPVEIRIGAFHIDKPLLLWVNDGLMAVFFFLIGLELKREVLCGELSDKQKVVLPVVAAVGGMCMPAVIYAVINWGDPVAMKGWAIPSATDIAFALGVLSLLGDRVPNSLKLFLLTLAVVDDLGAIIIIALFYTSDLSVVSLGVGVMALAVLYMLNRRGVESAAPYLMVGLVLWVAVLKSGVHATLAGVLVALFIPLRSSSDSGRSTLEDLEHDLHPSVVFVILPLFAFMNTGVSLDGLSMESFTASIPLGIALGLFFGNQIGVLGFSWITVKLGFAKLPDGVNWLSLYGVAALCGIGFTMSLFISSLAFEQGGNFAVDDRLGILAGSVISALFGYMVLKYSLQRKQAQG